MKNLLASNRRAFAFFVFAFAALIISVRYIAPWLFLVYKIGWTRVHQENIRILAMPKGSPWPLSDGEAIREGFFIEYLIGLACWLAMIYAACGLIALITKLLRRPQP